MAKVFISYKRNIDPDTAVATEVFVTLREEHTVFIDTTIRIGERWAQRIHNEIRGSDYLIVFLSEHSVHSEMVIAEIEAAHHYHKGNGRPIILPVRLNYTEPFVYPLRLYLNPLQWAIWRNDFDTPRLIDELREAITGGVLPVDKLQQVKILRPAKEDVPSAFANIPEILGSPEGPMSHESSFYVERETDHFALDILRTSEDREKFTIVIKGPRQIGKSSLLNLLMFEAEKMEMRTAFIDFQLIERATIQNADIFYRQFCSLLSMKLDIEDRTEEYWHSPLGHPQKTDEYVREYILKKLKNPSILLAMDEVERMFSAPFRSDFFAMLRTWHRKINMVLVTSTEPLLFIPDPYQSPFNVGQELVLTDFTPGQISRLNKLQGNPLIDSQVDRLNDLLSGQPYLTRKAFYLITTRQITLAELLLNAYENDGPFGDHLRSILFRLSGQKKLMKVLAWTIKPHPCRLIRQFRGRSSQEEYFRLRGAGLIKGEGDSTVPRNKLYSGYFRRRLHG